MTLIIANIMMLLVVIGFSLYIMSINCDRAYERGYNDAKAGRKRRSIYNDED